MVVEDAVLNVEVYGDCTNLFDPSTSKIRGVFSLFLAEQTLSPSKAFTLQKRAHSTGATAYSWRGGEIRNLFGAPALAESTGPQTQT